MPQIVLTFYSMVVASDLGACLTTSSCIYFVFQGTLPLSVPFCAVLILTNVCTPSS